jgi:hypothetical protein
MDVDPNVDRGGTMNPIFNAMRQTLDDPRGVARWIIAQNFAATTSAMALALVSILTSILSAIVMLIAPDEMFNFTPLQLAIGQMVGLFVAAGLIIWVGRIFGGKGQFSDAVALVAWVEAIMFALQLVQFVALFILPMATIVLALVGLALLVWLMVHFIAELHGLANLWLVFFGMIGTLLAVSFVLAAVLTAAMGFTNA